MTLVNIIVTDNQCAPVTFNTGDTNVNAQLEVGETWTYRFAKSLATTTTNIATATGYYGNTPVNDTDQQTVTVPNTTPPPAPILRLAIEKLGKNITKQDPAPKNRVDANPGDTVQFTLNIVSDSTDPLNNVVIHDVLPSYILYVPGSTQVGGVSYPDGIAGAGITIGILNPGGSLQVTFRATIGSGNLFATGTTMLINTAYVRADGIGEHDASLPIYVTKNILIPVGEVQTGVDGITLTLLVSLALAFMYYVAQSGLGFLRVAPYAAESSAPAANKKILMTMGILLFLLAGSLGLSSGLKRSQIAAIEIHSPIIHTPSATYFGFVGRSFLIHRLDR